QLNQGKKYDVCHERPAPPVAVGKETKDHRSERPHGQCHCRCENDFRRSHAKLSSQRVHEKNCDKEVEGIEHPTEKACGDGVTLVGGESRLRRMADCHSRIQKRTFYCVTIYQVTSLFCRHCGRLKCAKSCGPQFFMHRK